MPLRRECREDERDLLPLAEHDTLDVAEKAVGNGLAALADHVRATVPPRMLARPVARRRKRIRTDPAESFRTGGSGDSLKMWIDERRKR